MRKGRNVLPVIEAVDILVLVHRPLLGNVVHSEFLALVDKGCPGLEALYDGDQLGAVGAVGGLVAGETTDSTRLVVVLEVEGVPAVVVVHETLPLIDGLFELGEGPLARGKFALGTVVEIHA